MFPMPRFAPRGPLGRAFPRFSATIEALRLPAVPPTALRFLRLVVPREHALLRSRRRCVRQRRAWGCSPGGPGRDSSVETTGAPKFLGNPDSRLRMFSDPGRPMRPRPSWDDRMVPAKGKTRAPTTKIFRGSIAWLSGWLSTYHGVGYPSPRKTHSRPLVRRYRTGFHPQGSTERFSTHVMFVGLLSQASWHNPRN